MRGGLGGPRQRRRHLRDIAQHPILGELLVAMDGTDGNSGVLAVATTNNLNLLDGAIRARPGRFDRVIAVEPRLRTCAEPC